MSGNELRDIIHDDYRQALIDMKRERYELRKVVYDVRMIAQENVLKLTKSSRELGYHGYLKIIEQCDSVIKECE